MSSIFGILSKKGRQIPGQDFDRAFQLLKGWPADQEGHLALGPVRFGSLILQTTQESRYEKQPFQSRNTGLLIVADARIDYRDQLLGEMDLDPGSCLDIPDSQLILKAYEKWGHNCTSRLFGDYAFAIWDSEKESLFCARDHFGCRPFYYFQNGDFFVFASELKALLSISFIPSKIKLKWLAEAGNSIVAPSNESAFEDIFRLRPAHFLELSDGESREQKYWELQKNTIHAGISEEEATSKLKTGIRDAVAERCRSISPVGVELSGGLDSSGIAAIASEICAEQSIGLHAYSQVLADAHKTASGFLRDESAYSGLLVELSGIKLHRMLSGSLSGGLKPMIEAASMSGFPLLQSYAIMSDELYLAASGDGVRVLLSGFGGDETVSVRGHGYLDELARSGSWARLRKELKNNGLSSFFVSARMLKFRIISTFPGSIVPIRLFGKRRRKVMRRYRSFPLAAGLKRKYRTRRKFLRRSEDYKLSSMRKYQLERVMTPVNQTRFENSHLLAQARGIEYRYPFWDVKLLEFFYSLPSEYKYRDGISRYLYRMAMDDLLPKEICWRMDKTGATVPGVIPRLVCDLDKFRALIEEGRDHNRRHYFNYKKLLKQVEQIGKIPEGRPMPYGIGLFMYAIGVLHLQKEEREGRIDIGIDHPEEKKRKS